MEKIDDAKKIVQGRIKSEPVLSAGKNGVKAKAGKYFRRIIYLTSIAGLGLFVNSCVGGYGYVNTEPAYVEYERPARPSELHVWVDGDYSYNRQSHNYVQRQGSWVRPNQGQVYVTGSWQTSSRGKYWAP